jgi:hypothetical protein
VRTSRVSPLTTPRFEVLKAINMKAVFWNVTTCNVVYIYGRDGGNVASVFKVEEWSETAITFG